MKNLTLLLVILMLKPWGVQSQEQTAKSRFYEGVVAEEVTGDLDQALTIYQDLLKNSAGDRILAAKCLYHIGLTYEKKGSGKAIEYYSDVLEKYPDQADLADLARNRIAKLKDANTFIDPRDDHKYRWVKIGNQVWMAENLAYMPWVNPLHKQENGIWVYDYDGSDLAVAKASENYQKYGCLYDWPTAMGLDPAYLEKPYDGDTLNHQGICPTGWHMPTDSEWKELEMFLGMPDSAAHDEGFNRAGTFTSLNLLFEYPPVGKYLKSSSGWISNGNGDNSSKFNAFPAGTCGRSSRTGRPAFSGLGGYASFWTSSEYSYTDRNSVTNYSVWTRALSKGNGHDIERYNWDDKDTGESVRCVKNYSHEYPLVRYPVRKASEFIKPLKPETGSTSYPEPELIWSFNTPQIPFCTGIYKNMVIANADSSIHALDVMTGAELWERTFPTKTYEFVINGSRLFHISGGVLYCRNMDTWKEEWQFIAKESGVTVAVFKDRVILMAGSRYSRPPSSTSSFYCLNIDNGNLLWEQSAAGNIGRYFVIAGDIMFYGTSNIATLDAKQNYFTSLDLRTGEEKWKYPVGAAILSDPVIVDDKVVFTCTDQYVYALNVNTGSKIWRHFVGHRMFADPVIYDNTVFFGDLGEMFDNEGTACSFHAIDLNSGEQKWVASRVSPLVPDGIFNEWSVVLGNSVVTQANRGSLFAFDHATGKIVWKYQGGKGIVTSRAKPVVSDGILIVANKEGIYALRSPKK